MKGIYLSILGLALVNLIQFLTEFVNIDSSLVLIIKAAGFIFLIVGAVLSYVQGKTIEIPFDSSEFTDGKLIIPYRKFKKKLPVVDVFQKDDNGLLERILIDVKHCSNKDLIIGESANPFNGMVYIK